MSNNIDERIVEMQFDNAQFERNIDKSIKSLEELKKSLNLEASAKSLSSLERAGNSFSLAGISKGVEALADKFSTLGIIGITAIQRITNAAITAGERIVSSLTIDPVKTGLTEYETKMNAIKTILANTSANGTTLEDVNDALADLNTYADKTVYNFAQMTDMVGKFAATSGELDSSVSIVKGMANLAAEAGANNTSLQGALYQISQVGSYFQKIDWNSIRNANMATKKFQDDLVAMGEKMGTFKGLESTLANLKNGTEDFGNTLEKGWLTNGVFAAVANMYSLDDAMTKAAGSVTTLTKLFEVMSESVQSGWATSWEKIIGNSEQSAALLTGISDAFQSVTGASANARNSMLDFWSANGGRQDILIGISNILIGLGDALAPIEKAFREIFPPMTGERLVEISKRFRELTEGFKMGKKTADNIGRTFKGLFAVLDIVGKGLKFTADAVWLLVKAIAPGAGGGLLSATASLSDFIVAADKYISKHNVFNKALEKVSTTIDNISDSIKPYIDALKEAISNTGSFESILAAAGGTILGVGTKIKDAYNSILDAIDSKKSAKAQEKLIKQFKNEIPDALSSLNGTGTDALEQNINNKTSAVERFGKALKNILLPVLKKLDGITLQDIGAFLTGGSFLMLAKSLTKVIDSVGDIKNSFVKILDEVGNSLKAFQLKVKAEALQKVAIALAILTAAIVVLSFIKLENIAKSLGALGVACTILVVGLKALSKIDKVQKISVQMVALGTALLLLANSVSILGKLNFGQAVQGVSALAILMTMLGAFIKFTNGGDLAASAGGLVGFSIGITILTGALAILGKMNYNNLLQGAVALEAIMFVIAMFVTATKGGDLATSAGGMVGFALGITILTVALTKLGKLNIEVLQQGSTAIIGLMGVIAMFISFTNGMDLAASAGGMVGFAVGITIMSVALAKLGKMDFNALQQGGVAIAGIMLAIGLFIKLTNGGDLAASAGGMAAFALGIRVLAIAIKSLAELDPNRLVQGTVAISGLMLILALFISSTREGDLKGSAAGLIGFSAGITILSVALSILAALNPSKLQQGVIAVTALIAVIGLFINLTRKGDLASSASGLVGFATGIMMLAGVIAILSALNTNKLMMASVAISMLIGTIGLFINITRPGDLKKSAVGMLGFAAGIIVMSEALIRLSALNAAQLLAAGTAIALLLGGITIFITATNGADMIASAGGLLIFSGAVIILAGALTILGSLDIATLVLGVGSIAATFVVLGLSAAVLSGLTPVILALSASFALLGVGILAIGAGAYTFAAGMAILSTTGSAGVAVITNAVKGIIALIPQFLTAVGQGILNIATVIGNGAQTIAASAIKVIMAILNAITTNTPKIINSVFKMVAEILKVLVKYVPIITDAGMKILIGFLKGIASNIKAVVTTGADIVINFIEGIASKLPELIQAGFDLILAFINGIADGIRNNTDAVIGAVGNLIDSIIDAAIKALTASVKGFFDVGKNVVQGLMDGMGSMIKDVAESAANIGSKVLEAAKNALGIHSPSTMFKAIGNNIIAGLTKGIEENTSKAVKSSTNMSNDVTKAAGTAGTTAVKKSNESAKSAFDKAVEWIDERKYYNKLSLEEELAAWKRIQAQYSKGSDERTKADKEVYRVRQEMRKKEYDDAVQKIDDQKYYDKLTLEEELVAWQDIQKQYKHGTEENTKADKEIYRIRKELRKEDYDDEVKSISDKKYYNKLTLEEELADWQALQKEYKKGTAEREEADKEAYRVQQEMRQKDYDDAVQNIDDLKYYDQLTLGEELKAWEEIQKKYKEGDEERIKADKEVYRVKKEINQKIADLDEEYYSKSKELNDKLAQDIQDLNDEYDNAVKSRADSLYSAFNLFDKVEPKNVSGQDLIANLESQVVAFDDWTSNIGELAKKGISEELIKELQEMGPSSLAEIKALNSLTQPELDQYALLWQEKHKDAKTQAVGELEGLRIETANKIAQITSETQTELDELKLTWQNAIEAIKVTSDTQLDELETIFSTSTETIATTTETTFTTMKDNIEKIDWPSIGKNICNGIASGIQTHGGTVVAAAQQMAMSAYIAAKEALDINSPSKVFSDLGMFTAKGFANGITYYANEAVKAANSLGTSSIHGLQQAIVQISDFIDAGIDTEPVIRPVLDLSNVSSNIQKLNGMLSNNAITPISISNQNGIANGGHPTVININTQSLSPQELDNIFTYLNYRFGGAL